MHITEKRIYQLKRTWTDRWNDVKTDTWNYTSMRKASDALMSKLIRLAKKNIQTATTVKGAIRGNGVQTIRNLTDEVENHGFRIVTIHIEE